MTGIDPAWQAPPIWGDDPTPHLVILTPTRNHIQDIVYPRLLASGIQAALDWHRITDGIGVTSVGCWMHAHVADARCRLTQQFLEMDGHLGLWVDDDMAPPPDLFGQLYRSLWQLRNAKINVGAVSALCRRVTPPYESCLMKGGTWIEPNPNGPEFISVDSAGFGAILVTRDCMEAVYEDTGGRPFELRPGKGEDSWFCEHAIRLGFKVFGKLNCFVGHREDHIVDEQFVKLQRTIEHVIPEEV